ncbi:MAG: mechanosensitive ion channel family protein [Cyanobacteria bacterium J06639_1]
MQHRDRVLAETTIPDPIVLEPDADAPIPEEEQQRIAKHNADIQKQKADLEQVKSRFDLLSSGARLAQVAIWGGAIGLGLGLFAPTRWLQVVLIQVLSGVVLKVVAIALAAYVMVRVSFVAIDWLFAAIGNGEFLPDDASPRLTQRIQTFSVVLKGLTSAGLTGIGFLMTLAVLGLDIGPILAGAGILGLAVSFGAQSLVKDVINGFLILLEDQYGVGDVIIVDSVAGFVERMNLRVTQLRSADGNLITIPNGSITVVQNITNQWSRVNLGIEVAYNTDLDKAIALIEQVARQMMLEPYWRDLILEDPTVLGVDEFGDNSITIRLWIRTKPLKHWEVGRQYRLRMKKAFDREGISIPFPQRSVWFENSLESKALMSGNGAIASESGDRVALS